MESPRKSEILTVEPLALPSCVKLAIPIVYVCMILNPAAAALTFAVIIKII